MQDDADSLWTVYRNALEAQVKAASVDITVARALISQCESVIKTSSERMAIAKELLDKIALERSQPTGADIAEAEIAW